MLEDTREPTLPELKLQELDVTLGASIMFDLLGGGRPCYESLDPE